MRLIDADALLDHQFKNDISYNAFRSLVKRQATIDAVPVKHGVWSYGSEIAREYRADGVHIYYEKCFCSICGYEENYKPYWNYCPNCGAKMDGGKADE